LFELKFSLKSLNGYTEGQTPVWKHHCVQKQKPNLNSFP